MGAGHLYRPTIGGLRVPYIAAYSTPSGAKVETKNHNKTMKIKVPEAEILRTPIKIEKLSLWNRSRGGFIMDFEFHGFLEKNTPSPSTPLPPLAFEIEPSLFLGEYSHPWLLR